MPTFVYRNLNGVAAADGLYAVGVGNSGSGWTRLDCCVGGVGVVVGPRRRQLLRQPPPLQQPPGKYPIRPIHLQPAPPPPTSVGRRTGPRTFDLVNRFAHTGCNQFRF